MCTLTELYQQVLGVVALTGDALAVHLNASVDVHGPYYSVGITAPAYAAPGDVLAPEVGRASATSSVELLAKLAQALKVANPYALPQYALLDQKAEISRLLNHPLITRQEKTYTLLRFSRMDEDQAQLAIEELRSKIDQRVAQQD